MSSIDTTHEWQFDSSHGVETRDDYHYCPRCGSTKHNVTFLESSGEWVQAQGYPLYRSIGSEGSTTVEPPCIPDQP